MLAEQKAIMHDFRCDTFGRYMQKHMEKMDKFQTKIKKSQAVRKIYTMNISGVI